jgi:hypothetical protein
VLCIYNGIFLFPRQWLEITLPLTSRRGRAEGVMDIRLCLVVMLELELGLGLDLLIFITIFKKINSKYYYFFNFYITPFFFI